MTINLTPDEFKTILEIINVQILISVRQELFTNAEQLRLFKAELIKKRDMSLLLKDLNINSN